jgi:hypothetical protein
MTRGLIGVLLILAAAGIVSAFLWYLRLTEGERQTHSFATHSELQASGLIERGWVPPWIPRSATQIEEAHDLDTSRARMRFRVPVEDARTMTAHLAPLSHHEALRRGASRLYLSEDSISFYLDPSNAAGVNCVAVGWRSGIVHGWSC